MRYYLQALSKYAVFDGRARRKEYWSFVGINLLFAFGFGIVCGLLKLPEYVPSLYTLATFLPHLTVGARRCHDSGRSGWFLAVPFYGFYLLIRAGDVGPNDFGPDPKAEGPGAGLTAASGPFQEAA